MISSTNSTAPTGGGDHFAKPGANDRIWNSLEKHCLRDPENFAAYYGNAIIALGQRSLARPELSDDRAGQSGQSGRRSAVGPPRLPSRLPVLRRDRAVSGACPPALAGADAAGRGCPLRHAARKRADLFLPYSQTYVPGYLALKRQEFRDYFETNHVQLPLEKGDVVFFNPALFHAAGTNRSEGIKRVANLLQVSSAFGRAMETVNRIRMSARLFPALKSLNGRLSHAESRTPSPPVPRAIPSRPTSTGTRRSAACAEDAGAADARGAGEGLEDAAFAAALRSRRRRS
jgi:hypothetical protein